MKLSSALRLAEGEVVAFVGGGGKTTAMFRLADEIVEAGGRVITTTTTRIFAAQVALAPLHFSAFEVNRAQIEQALIKHPHLLLTGPVNQATGKASGVSPDLIAELQHLPDLTAILIEADGSRMRPFKAPAEHEPVIPTTTTLVVPIIGSDVLGQPLNATHVHRPELIQALTSALPDTIITPELVAAVITHPNGGLKNIPPDARVVPLINKVDAQETLAASRTLAQHLLHHPRMEGVVLGAVKRYKNPVSETHGRVAALVLAAGRSSRMGQPKPVLPWGETTLIEEVVRRLHASGVEEIVVVTGAAREAVEAALAHSPARLIFNPDYATSEMARSLQVGLKHLSKGVAVVVVALADQPQLEPDVVRAVIQRWRETLAPITAPIFEGRRGHPVVFDRALWPRLEQLPPDANPRAIFSSVEAIEKVEVRTETILQDIDTPEDYAQAQARMSLL